MSGCGVQSENIVNSTEAVGLMFCGHELELKGLVCLLKIGIEDGKSKMFKMNPTYRIQHSGLGSTADIKFINLG